MNAEIPTPDGVCDGGDLDCGSGLLLIIRNHMTPISGGGVLEVRSRESSVKEDLPAWCRMVGHAMLDMVPAENQYTRYFIRKKGETDETLDEDLSTAKDFKWKVRVKWTEGMKARAFARNHAFDVGQPTSFDTEDEAPGAVEYLLASIGGCLAVGFQWRASREGIEVYNLEVTLQAKSDNILVFLGLEDEGHAGLEVVEGKLYVDGDADDDVWQRLWDETVQRSPVTQSIARPIPVDIEMRSM
jgi:uncharacterized OsmC-like protein/TusA-related sulfurtransferase